MRNMRQLVVDARREERHGNLQRAIDLYRKALALQEKTAGSGDLSLYNRLGDLYLRHGDPGSAVKCFEEAVGRYEEQQLYSNAIALCKKILRNAPGYTKAYRRAGRLLALAGLNAEARQHYIQYANRMEREGSLDAALDALQEFVELSGDEEVRLALADRYLLADRTERALEELRHVWRERTGRGEDAVELRRRIVEVDPEADPLAPRAEPEAPEPGRAPEEGEGGRATAPGPGPSEEASRSGPPDEETDMESLAGELQRVLNRLDGEARLRHALPLIDQLLEFEPEKVSLLQRKLEYALALGEEAAAIEAYLALGAALDKKLSTFSLRFLTSSSGSEGVTTAIKVEDRSANGG